MRFHLRADLGGRAADIPVLSEIGDVEIVKPFLFVVGANGTGKSSLLAALRQATGLVGPGLGKFRDEHDYLLALPDAYPWSSDREKPVDFARHMFLTQRDSYSWSKEDGKVPEDGIGVLDPVALGWVGQRIWLHDARVVDNHDASLGDMDLTSMRRASDDQVRSHGEQMTGRLRYAAAWALGMFDLKDAYDRPEPDKNSYDHRRTSVQREVFSRLSGQRPSEPGRTDERWLLLDEPENGLDPIALAKLLATLAENAAVGRFRVICVTHSGLALSLAGHPNVQILDMDGYGRRMTEAYRTLSDPAARSAVAEDEFDLLRRDCEEAVSFDRGLTSQGRFTAHEAQSIPYASAIVPPYGKQDCLERMRGRVSKESDQSPKRRR